MKYFVLVFISHCSSVFSISFEDGNFRIAAAVSSTVGSGWIFVNRFIPRGSSVGPFGLFKSHWNSDIHAAYGNCSLWIFQVSCSLFHLCCIAIWLVIKHNLCCDLRLYCNHNFDHSGTLIDWLVSVVFTSHIEKVFHVKILVSSWSVFWVAAIICYCSSQILAS